MTKWIVLFMCLGVNSRLFAVNNFVADLIDVRGADLTGKRMVEFTNPRKGWCYLHVVGEAKLRLDDAESPVVLASGEAMLYLPAGRHVLHIDGRPSGLIVRAVPILQHAFYKSGDAWNFSQGKNDDWDFLKKHVLPHVNVVISPVAVRPEHLKEWKDLGRQWLMCVHNEFPDGKMAPVDAVYQAWSSSPGLTNPLMDGIIVDEFGGGDQPMYEVLAAATERIHANPKFKDKTCSPYTYSSGIMSSPGSRKFGLASIAGGGFVHLERYQIEQPTRAEAEKHIREKLMAEWNLPRFEKDSPGVTKGTVMVLGDMSAIGESLNINPGVDFKVYLDMQMQLLATDPAFAGLAGIQQYHSGYADEETVRWAARLFRHYAIEGKTTLLSDELGYKYELQHIKNPDFADGTSSWTIKPAGESGITTGTFPKYGYLQFRYWADGSGDRFLVMKRNQQKPNIIEQQINNLTPGKLYSLKMVSGDRQDLEQSRSESKLHAIHLDLDNVEPLSGEEHSFQKVFPNHYARPAGEFKGKHTFYMNYYWRVFRAKETTATLRISDWKDQADAGGPVGQELMLNFIEVQPYFGE